MLARFCLLPPGSEFKRTHTMHWLFHSVQIPFICVRSCQHLPLAHNCAPHWRPFLFFCTFWATIMVFPFLNKIFPYDGTHSWISGTIWLIMIRLLRFASLLPAFYTFLEVLCALLCVQFSPDHYSVSILFLVFLTALLWMRRGEYGCVCCLPLEIHPTPTPRTHHHLFPFYFYLYHAFYPYHLNYYSFLRIHCSPPTKRSFCIFEFSSFTYLFHPKLSHSLSRVSLDTFILTFVGWFLWH